MDIKNSISISARSSHLARLQAEMVGQALKNKFKDITIQYYFRESLGDKNLHDPLWKMPDKGVFTEDFYQDLVDEKTDMVVHSWKDLPVLVKDDTFIAATLPRADQRDLLIFKRSSFERLQKERQSTLVQIFTSSPRREYNLKSFFRQALPYHPEVIEFKNIRGNVPTRIKKFLEDATVDGLVLAKAAVDRFTTSEWSEVQEVRDFVLKTLNEQFWMTLPLSANPNAAAQGALAIEVKKTNTQLISMLKEIHDESTFLAAHLERHVLKSFGGGCHQKIGVTVKKVSTSNFNASYFFQLKGLTDQGQVLNQQNLLTQEQVVENARHQFNLSNLLEVKNTGHKTWSSSVLNSYFTVVEKNTIELTALQNQLINDSKNSGLYVSKATALSQNLVAILKSSPAYIWSSGLSTWFNLSKQGVWVNGTSDGLGEQQTLGVEHYNQHVKWIKLTHSQAQKSQIFSNLATYSLEFNLEKAQNDFSKLWNDFVSADEIYWTSTYFFQKFSELIQLQKENIQNQFAERLKKDIHLSGPGLTYATLKETIPCLKIKI